MSWIDLSLRGTADANQALETNAQKGQWNLVEAQKKVNEIEWKHER